MPGPLLQLVAVMTCPHAAGQVKPASTNTRVLAGGSPVVTIADTFLIAGCPFTVPGPKPQPCMRVQWSAPATRVFVNGSPALLQASVGTCLSADQIPAGPPVISVNQPRVVGM
jgi:hypothetical protein